MGLLRGLVVREDGLVLTWTGTPVGPLPGEVVEADGQTSAASWTTSGAMVGATSPALDLRVARAGLPGDAQILWREDGEDNYYYYGWDALHVAHHLRRLIDTGDTWRASCAIRLADGTALAALSRGDEAIEVWRSVAPGTTVEVYVRSGGALPAGELHASLVQLPSGRVLLHHWLYRDGSLQVRAWRSDDGGASWSLHQRECLPAALDVATYTPYRLRAAVIGDAILLLGHVLHSAPQDRIVQWASSDGGASFVQIVNWGGQARGWPEILVSGGRAVVVYLAYRSATAPNVLPYRRVLASAYESIAEADSAAAVDVADFEWGAYSGGEITSGELASIADGETLWLWGQNHDGGHAREIHAAVSIDGGDAWTTAGSSAAGIEVGRVWAGGSSSIYPADIVAAPWLGGALLLHRWEGGDDPDGLFGLEVGGYRVLTLPTSDEGDGRISDQTSWTRTWLPAATPDALDAGTWTETVSGTPAYGVDGAGLIITSGGSGQAVAWTATPNANPATGLLVEADVSPGTANAYVDVAVGNGSTRFYVRASWDGAVWTLRDMIAGSDLDTVDTITSTATRHRLLIALDSGAALLQVSEVMESDAGADGAEIGRASGTPTGSGSSGADAVAFGMLSGSLSGEVCEFHGIAWAERSDTGEGLAGGQGLAERQGRPVGAAPVWISRGLQIAACGGAAGVGEVWSISSRYSYDGDHADPLIAPSSSVPARWTAAPVLTWTWADGLARTPLALPALYLERVNFRRALLEYRDHAGTWQSLGTLDLALASALGWTRSGSGIVAAATGSSSGRFSTESLVGGYFVHAVPLGVDRVWPILRNNGGRFLDPSSSGQLLRIEVSGALSGDPTSGTTGAIIPPRVLIVLPPSLLSTPFRAVRLSPSSVGAAAEDADSGEAYYQIGAALMGLLYPFGRQYSHGRVSEVASSGEVTRGLSGAVIAARRRGEARYAAEFSWSDAVDEYPLSRSAIPTESAYGVDLATPAAALPDLQGVIERAGQDVPVVYVAALTLGSGTVPTVHHGERRDLLRGLLSSEVFRLDTVWGTEGGSEVRRGGTLRVEEVG